MKIAFSTLACFDWPLKDIVAIATRCGYDGLELRFVESEDALYKLSAFRGTGLTSSKRLIADAGLAICCVDTSCRFHFPELQERVRWVEEGIRMAALSAELGSPAIRVFGDAIQAGADRESTRSWIADCICELSAQIRPMGVEVWLETHGDFASVSESMQILSDSQSETTAIIWDPANCMAQSGERPLSAIGATATRIKHVHVKDQRREQQGWVPVLTGEGVFPFDELQSALLSLDYQGFLSYEWERKWHPQIPDAKLALPHFAHWFRNTWK
jgi:sugar phosphate isomerase/epimerase